MGSVKRLFARVHHRLCSMTRFWRVGLSRTWTRIYLLSRVGRSALAGVGRDDGSRSQRIRGPCTSFITRRRRGMCSTQRLDESPVGRIGPERRRNCGARLWWKKAPADRVCAGVAAGAGSGDRDHVPAGSITLISPILLRSVIGQVACGVGPSRVYATARGYQEELRTIPWTTRVPAV